MATCKDECKHAIFCPTWGEYKCTKKKRVMSPWEAFVLTCNSYEKGTNDITECHCESCEKRGKEDDY